MIFNNTRRKILAFVLVVCMVLCNTNISAFALGTEDKVVDCKIQLEVQEEGVELSGLSVTLKDSSGVEVIPTTDVYQLVVGEKYDYTVTGIGIEETTGTFTAQEGKNGSYTQTIDIPAESIIASDKDEKVNYELNFYYKEKTDSIELEVEIKNGNDVISAEANGSYNLLPNTNYTYTINTTGVIPDNEIEFKTPDNNSETKKIDIKVKLVEPEFTVDDIDIENVTELKQDAKVQLRCTNVEELYNNGNDYWKVAISEKLSKSLKENESYEVVCPANQLSITCSYGNYSVNNDIPTFKDYTLKAEYGGMPVDASFTPVASKLESGVSQSVNVSAKGFKDNTITVTPVSYQREITISVGAVQAPEISYNNGTTLQAYCGGSIDLSVIDIDEDSYNESLEWDWYFNGEKVEGDYIDLTNVKENIYELKYVYSNNGYIIESNAISVKVEKLELGFDLEAWEAKQERKYDATNIFNFTVALSSPYITLENIDEEEKEKYPCLKDDKLRIEVVVESSDASEESYDSLKVSSVSICGNSDRYNIETLEKTIVNQEKNNKVNLVINRTTVNIKAFKAYFQYRINELSIEKSINGIIYEVKQSDELSKKLLEMMGTASVQGNRCTFSNIQYNSGVCIQDQNVEYMFNENTYSKDEEGNITFDADYTYEILHIENITDVIELNDVISIPSVTNWFWVGGVSQISASIKNNSRYEDVTSKYSSVSFKEVYVDSWDELSKSNISENGGLAGDDSFKLTESKEKYYAVMLDTEAHSNCSTVVAIVRFIPEANVNFFESYPNKIGDYPVITLFQDKSGVEVKFEDAKLERTSDADIVVGEVSKSDNIKFTINEGCSGVKNVEFAIVPLDKASEYYCVERETYDPKGISTENLDYTRLEWEESGRCKAEFTLKDGDYVICVRTVSGSGIERTYISNGFFVDSTSPQITSSFITENGENLCKEIAEGKEIYRNQSIIVKFEVEEEHLECFKVIITKSDVDGNEIGECDVYTVEATKEKNIYQMEDIILDGNANYKIEVLAIDRAGNSPKQNSDKEPEPEIYTFTVDKEAPDSGTIEVVGPFKFIKSDDGKKNGVVKMEEDIIEKLWDKFEKEIAYTVFGKDTIKYTLTGSDAISPVDISYYLYTGSDTGANSEVLTENSLKALPEDRWIAWNKGESGTIEVNKNCVIYERVKDKAGNISYFCSEGMITDNYKPDISVTFNKKANKNGFFNSNVSFSAVIEDKVPDYGTACSGLQYVAYYLEKDGKRVDSSARVLYNTSENKAAGENLYKINKESISAKDFNSNDVTLCVTAVDNSGNKTTEKKSIKIDNEKPVISVTYNDEAGAQYYNHTRTATISIKERNLDTNDVKIVATGAHGNKGVIGKWSHTGKAGKSDNVTYTCQVTFTEDDDYKFTVSCVDKAGNKAVKNFSDEFTIDGTKPIISVSYNGTTPEQNAYYNEPLTATITITEHNFNANKVNVQLRAENGSASGVSGFSSNGDVHTATVSCSTDGIYRLNVAYTDEAGNAADSYSGSTFTVDLINPEIKITNIQNKSANKDDVKPIITCTDINYDEDKVAIKLYGANNGEIDLDDVAISSQAVNNGEQFTLDFPKTQMLDDVYTLTAEVTDRAGNETEESIEFSVNRFGSVYTLGTETGEWLTNGVCSYIQEGKPIVIVETNVDEVLERNIAYTEGGVNAKVVTVSEADACSSEEKDSGTYYEMKDNKNGSQWYQYEYIINANNFVSEGRYSIQIDSTDKAGNHTSNVSNKHTEGNLVVEFAVDQTAPSAVITGAEDRKVYNETSHTVYLDVQDNLATDYVTVYLNGEEYGTYKASDIEELEDGLIPVKVEQSISTQTIQLMAKDMAGNILSEKSEGKYDKTFDDFHILVTTNVFVQVLHTSWLWLLLLVFAACGIGVVIIIKKKKSN